MIKNQERPPCPRALNALCWLAPFVLAACGPARAEPAARGSYQGTIELDEWVLGFEVPGRVAEIRVREGDRVEQGAALASLDATLAGEAKNAREREAEAARAQVAVVEAGTRREEVRSADARVRAARATEELLKSDLSRERTLLERGASTPEAVSRIQGRLERAMAERQALDERLAALKRGARSEEVDAARARAVATEAAVALEDERIARHAIAAPVAGAILDVHAKAGEVVLAGVPVLTLADARRPYADVFVPQGELSGIDVGDAAEVRIDAEREAFTGRVETIARRTEFTPRYLFSERERKNLVVRVRVRIDDPGERLHAGVPAFVQIERGAPAKAAPAKKTGSER